MSYWDRKILNGEWRYFSSQEEFDKLEPTKGYFIGAGTYRVLEYKERRSCGCCFIDHREILTFSEVFNEAQDSFKILVELLTEGMMFAVPSVCKTAIETDFIKAELKNVLVSE